MEAFFVFAAVLLIAFAGHHLRNAHAWRRQSELLAAARQAARSATPDGEQVVRKALRHARIWYGPGSVACAEPLETIGIYFENRGEPEVAIRYYSRAIRLAEQEAGYADLRASSRLRMGWCYFQLGKLQEAMARVELVQRADAQLLRAAILSEEGELLQAEALLRSWLRGRGLSTEADAYRSVLVLRRSGGADVPSELEYVFGLLADITERLGRRVEARRWRMEAILQIQCNAEGTNQSLGRETLQLARSKMAESDWAGALELLHTLGTSTDSLTRASTLAESAYCEQCLHHPTEALRLFERAVETAAGASSAAIPVARHAWLRIAELLAERDPERALRAFAASNVAPDTLDEFDVPAIATARWLTGNHEDALALVEDHSRRTERPDDLLALANWNLLRGRTSAARANLGRVETLAPRLWANAESPSCHVLAGAHIGLASYAADFDEVEALIERVERGTSSETSSAWTRHQRGLLALDRGNAATAARNLIDALALAPPVTNHEWLAHVHAALVRALLASEQRDEAFRWSSELDRWLRDDRLPELGITHCELLAVSAEVAHAGDESEIDAPFLSAIARVTALAGFAPCLRVRWARLLFARERDAEAEAAAAEAIEEATGVYADSHPLIGHAHCIQGRVALRARETERGRFHLEKALQSYERHGHVAAAEVRRDLAR